MTRKTIDIAMLRSDPEEVERLAMIGPVDVMRDGKRVMVVWIPQDDLENEEWAHAVAERSVKLREVLESLRGSRDQD